MLHNMGRRAHFILVLITWALLTTIFGCVPKVIDDGLLNGEWYLQDTSAYGYGGAWDFRLPFPSGDYYLLTQGYGSTEDGYSGSHRDYKFQYGDDTYALDFAQNGCDVYGDNVVPIMDGTILRTGTEGSSYDQGYGNNILVSHANGLVSRYAHLSEIYVSNGESVSDTDVIGAVGNTGNCYGSACQDHPGAHLHIAVYENETAIPPLPISGADMQVGCWYNREGEENCASYPGPYGSQDDNNNNDSGSDDGDNGDDDNGDGDNSGNGDVNVTYVGSFPGHGIAGETEFLWVAVVEADSEPDVTLIINNPNDGVDYDFNMEAAKDTNPYVFYYKKTLRDPIEYEYRVSAESGSHSDTEYGDEIEVDSDNYGSIPEFDSAEVSPSSGEADDTEFSWRAIVDSDHEPEVTLMIVNPNDANAYEFQMEVEGGGGGWVAEYEKTLRDPTTYVYWMVAEVDELTSTSDVLTMEVE